MRIAATASLVVALAAISIAGCPGGAADQPTADDPADGDTTGVTSGTTTADNDEPNADTEELIVSVVPGADRDDVETLYDELGVTLRDRLSALSVDLLGVDADSTDQVTDALEDSPLIEDVVENTPVDVEITPDDPLYGLQWHLEAIGAPAAWEITTGSEDVLIAVLDTGVDTDHVDLQSKLRVGGNTFDGTSGYEDVIGHGTEVAGIIAAAADSAAGVASVAWKNPIIPIRVTGDDGQATSWSIAAGIALAIDLGARVINVSFAPLHHDDIVLRQAHLARLAGSLVIIASDNSGEKINGGGSDSVCFVGAIDRDQTLAGFSTHGDFVDLVAPGVSIYTTRINDEYGASSGTSLAAPIVSGVAALIWSLNPDLLPTTVQSILVTTAIDLGVEGDDAEFGAGLVDAHAALELARVIEEQSDTTAPTLSILQPADLAVVSGATAVEVEVSDGNDLADVTLTLDGTIVATDSISPYAFVIDTDKYAAGDHTLLLKATDVFGNAAQRQITLSFSGPRDASRPTVAIVSPAEGDVISGTVTVIADVTDDRSLAKAEILLDETVIGTVILSGLESRIAFNLNTADDDVPSGSHTLSVRLFDTSDNQRTASISVTIEK